MKKLIFFLVVFIAAAFQLKAQKSPKPSSLFSGKLHSSGYGALSTQYSSFNGESAIFTGAYGGWMINHKLMIGLGGYGLVTSHDGYAMNDETDGSHNKLKMGYGGLMLEYTFLEQKRFHVTTNLLVGGGFVANASKISGPGRHEDTWQSKEESGFAVIQPGINIETDITPWFRIGVGGGYRYIASANMSGISNSKMSAPTANVSLKFGVF